VRRNVRVVGRYIEPWNRAVESGRGIGPWNRAVESGPEIGP